MGAVTATSWATSMPCLGQAEWNKGSGRLGYNSGSQIGTPGNQEVLIPPHTNMHWPPGWGGSKMAEVRPKDFATFHNIYFC